MRILAMINYRLRIELLARTTIFALLAIAVSINASASDVWEKADSKYDRHELKKDLKHQRKLHKKGWRKVWSDEFSRNSIKPGKWSHEVNCAGGGNNEQQCYTDRPENSYVEDGSLHIVAREEAYQGPAVFDDDPAYDPNDVSNSLPFTSARLRTKNKFDFKYGRAEIRAKLAQGQGMWPAIWMLPTENVYGVWPQSGEIDIVEAVNIGVWPNEVHGTLHYGLKWPQWENHGQTYETGFDPSADFHTYAIEWEADEIRWYVDGKHYQTQSSEGWYNYVWKGQKKGFKVANKRAPYNKKFHLIMNLAVGGDWPGNPDSNWLEDREMLVDYVRVYQCKKPRGKHKKTKHKNGKYKEEQKKSGEGCATLDDSVELNADAGAPQVNDFLFYEDGAEPLNLESNGDIVTSIVEPGFWELDPGTLFQNHITLGGRRGDVWDINFSGLGNVFLASQDNTAQAEYDRGVNLEGGSGWSNYGELEFKMRVLDAAEDSQFTVKLDSGWPNLGEVKIDTPTIGKWKNVKVRLSDLLSNPNPNGAGLDLSNIQNLFVLEYSGTSAHVQIDSIRLQCAVNSEPESWQQDQTCSMTPRVASVAPTGDELDIYVDSISNWNILECCTGAAITEVNDNGNNVLEIAYDTDPNTNTVTFFQSASPMDLSSFAGGTLEFDMLVLSGPSNPADDPWMVKVDCVFPCGTGDIPIDQSVEGELPQTGVWQHFTFNIDDLVSRGLDLSSVDAPLVLFPSWGSQDGAMFRLDNVRWLTSDSGGSGDAGPTLPVSFDDGAISYLFSDFEGAAASVVSNPNSSGINVSANVGEMLKYDGAVYAGSTLALDSAVDFASGSVITMKVLASRAVPVLLKLEGLNVELTANHSGSGEWEELTFDFTGLTGNGVMAITLIFDLGVVGDADGNPNDWTFYFDDISQNN
jgi:beta-glucanase (GH16 family)